MKTRGERKRGDETETKEGERYIEKRKRGKVNSIDTNRQTNKKKGTGRKGDETDLKKERIYRENKRQEVYCSVE